jgi:hypothetical protein
VIVVAQRNGRPLRNREFASNFLLELRKKLLRCNEKLRKPLVMIP